MIGATPRHMVSVARFQCGYTQYLLLNFSEQSYDYCVRIVTTTESVLARVV